MSKTYKQVYDANPVTTNNSNDIMTMSRSPYTPGNDIGILYSDFAAQLNIVGSPFNANQTVMTNGSKLLVTTGYGLGQFPLLPSNITTDHSIVAGDINGVFIATGAGGYNFTPSAQSGYVTGFSFTITNQASAAVTFTPHSGDNYNGNTSLTISPGESYTILKSVVANGWVGIYNYNTSGSSGYLLAANNLNDVNSYTASVNNIGLAVGYDAITSNTVLTNPCPTVIYCNPSPGITLQLPVMNSTTPGSKSISVGQVIRVYNVSSTYNVTLQYNSGGSFAPGTLTPGTFVDITLTSNATSDGTVSSQVYGTGVTLNASSLTGTPILSCALNPVVGWVGQLAVFADSRGSLTQLSSNASATLVTNSSGVPAWTSSMTNGQLLIGSTGATPIPNTLTAGPGVAIANAAGSITISGGGGGYFNLVEVDVAGSIIMVPNTVYFINNAGHTVFTLPSGAALPSIVGVTSLYASTGTFEIDQTVKQTIIWGPMSTTAGTGGSLVSNDPGQAIFLQATQTTALNELFTVIDNIFYNFTLN